MRATNERCSGLTSVTIGNSVTSFGNYAFKGCAGLTSVSITDIASWCKISFSTSVSNPLCYANHLYMDGQEVKYLVIPETVTSIGDNAFVGCAGLTSVTIPNSVESIGTSAFSDCSDIKTISIGTGIESIGFQAYARCKNIETFTCYAAAVPTMGTDVFKDSYVNNATLNVPKLSVDSYKAADQWREFGTITAIPVQSYKLTYKVDNTLYKEYTVEEGAAITPEADPTKEGYTFSGWDNVPTTMPAHDVIVSGTFKINQYTITFDTDGGSDIAPITQDYGTAITKPAYPTKTGYTFTGWDKEIPATMPAENMIIKAKWSINSYKLTYKIDNSIYWETNVEYNTVITPEPNPTKEGYTFSGWSAIPSRMPAHDVEVNGSFKVNQYTVKFVADGVTIKEEKLDFGSTITTPADPQKEGYDFKGWSPEVDRTVPSHDVTYTAVFEIKSGIESILSDENTTVEIRDISGQLIKKQADKQDILQLQKGIYIINGKKYILK